MPVNPSKLGTHASGVPTFLNKARRRRAYPTFFRTILNLRMASQTRARVYCGGRRGVGCRMLFAGVVGRAALPGAMAVLPERVSAIRFSAPPG